VTLPWRGKHALAFLFLSLKEAQQEKVGRDAGGREAEAM